VDKQYIDVNRRAYDVLATEYKARMAADVAKDREIVRPFSEYLQQTFGVGARVLDLGCGNGLNVRMLSDAGFQTTGIDLSPEMVRIARSTCPFERLILGDFLAWDFGGERFDGIFAKASLHLFPKKDATCVIAKAFRLLGPEGMLYIATTVADNSGEGFYAKNDYQQRVTRFRKFWQPAELLKAVRSAGFVVYRSTYNDEHGWNKRWFNVWAVRTLPLNDDHKG